jgi:hypothetical protein
MTECQETVATVVGLHGNDRIALSAAFDEQNGASESH